MILITLFVVIRSSQVHLCYTVALSLKYVIVQIMRTSLCLLIEVFFYYYVGDEFSMSVFGAVNSDWL